MSEVNADKICLGCMNEKLETVCKHCGFDESHYIPSANHLPLRTILNGKYLVGRVLGEGGFGITYIGIDLNLDLKVAIKEYYPNGVVTRDTTHSTVTPFMGEPTEVFETGKFKFINEAKSLAKFRALPGIVAVNDFFMEHGTAYIAMEYVDGQTLKTYLTTQKLSSKQVFDMMYPVMQSLAYVHQAGMIHRDISPDNIMITNDGQVKLLDFGAARDFADSGNKSLSVLLKLGYAPSEQYSSKGVQGPWTDIYALCATIYKIITGITPDESIDRLNNDELKPPSKLGIAINPQHERALLKGMSVNKDERFQSVPELMAAIYPQRNNEVTVPYSEQKPQVKLGAQPKQPKPVVAAQQRAVAPKQPKPVTPKPQSKKNRKGVIIGICAAAVLLVVAIATAQPSSPVPSASNGPKESLNSTESSNPMESIKPLVENNKAPEKQTELEESPDQTLVLPDSVSFEAIDPFDMLNMGFKISREDLERTCGLKPDNNRIESFGPIDPPFPGLKSVRGNARYGIKDTMEHFYYRYSIKEQTPEQTAEIVMLALNASRDKFGDGYSSVYPPSDGDFSNLNMDQVTKDDIADWLSSDMGSSTSLNYTWYDTISQGNYSFSISISKQYFLDFKFRYEFSYKELQKYFS